MKQLKASSQNQAAGQRRPSYYQGSSSQSVAQTKSNNTKADIPAPERTRAQRWNAEAKTSNQNSKWSQFMQEFKKDITSPLAWTKGAIGEISTVSKKLAPVYSQLYEAQKDVYQAYGDLMKKEVKNIDEVGKFLDSQQKLLKQMYNADALGVKKVATNMMSHGGKVVAALEWGKAIDTVIRAKDGSRTQVAFEQAGQLLVGTIAVLGAEAVIVELSPLSGGASLLLAIPAAVVAGSLGSAAGKIVGDELYEDYEKVINYLGR